MLRFTKCVITTKLVTKEHLIQLVGVMYMEKIRTIDLFCGAGGSSWGARRAGAEIVAGFDAWKLAGKVHQDNFPGAQFFLGRLENLSDRMIRSLGSIDLIIASPECTNHSPAKGSKPRCEKSKDTAFQVTRFARLLKPRWLVIENVVSMRNWTRYSEFTEELSALGYNTRTHVLDATEFGVPQRRRRLFILCDRDREPTEIVASRAKKRTAYEVVDPNGTYPFSMLRSPSRAKATLERAKRAIAELGSRKPFLIVYYGSDHAGGWQSLQTPLRTITTLDRFAYVKPTSNGHVMRMLQVPELKKAMGMPIGHRLEHGTRRDRIRMIGNAVCPPVMAAAVKSLVNNV